MVMTKGYHIRVLTAEEFTPLLKKHKASVFKDTHSYALPEILSDDERELAKDLVHGMGTAYTLYLGAFDADNNFVGWSWGFQESATVYYMVNSGVLNDHRRKGLYAALVDRCIHILSQKGFQLIYSRHCATNNAVIIPKLKAGFIISKMEIDDRFGVLIHLHFYTNKIRRKIMDYRSGQQKPDTEIKQIFKLLKIASP